MKKIWSLIILIIVWECSHSQTFRWKPTVGLNTSIQNVSNTNNNKVKIGFDIGVLMEAPLKENISLEIGYFYSQNQSSLQRTFIYPFDAPYLDAPQVKEDFSLNLLKAPITFLLKQNKSNPMSIGIGTVVKYNFNSHRQGFVVDRPEKYSSSFTIDTQSENKIGFGVQTSIRKEFSIQKNNFLVGLYYDTDLSKWRYPTNFDLEKKAYYALRSHNFSLMISYIL